MIKGRFVKFVVSTKCKSVAVDGSLMFSNNMAEWPRESSGHVLHSLHMFSLDNVTFTPAGLGTLDGQGEVWWGLPGIGYLARGENRPNLLKISDSSNLLVENLFFLNSPCWTFWAENVDGLEVRYCEIRFRILWCDVTLIMLTVLGGPVVTTTELLT